MNKSFEDYFSELQADMVSICLEYVEGKADKVYIYCSNEYNFLMSSFFYCINGTLKEKHKLNEGNDNIYDTSPDRQGAVLTIILEDMEKMMDLCKEYSKEIPTEIKMVYDVKKNSLKAEYKYDLVCYNDPVKMPDDIAKEWFDEINNKNGCSL